MKAKTLSTIAIAYSGLVLLIVLTIFIEPIYNFTRTWFPYSAGLMVYSIIIAIVLNIASLAFGIVKKKKKAIVLSVIALILTAFPALYLIGLSMGGI